MRFGELEKVCEINEPIPRLDPKVWKEFNKIVEALSKDLRDDKKDRWWCHFRFGVRDEEGTVWFMFDDAPENWRREGWKLYRCRAGESKIEEIALSAAIKTPFGTSKERPKGFVTFQLRFANERDTVNLIMCDGEPTKVRFWNHDSNMQPMLSPPPVERTLARSALAKNAFRGEIFSRDARGTSLTAGCRMCPESKGWGLHTQQISEVLQK